MKRRYYLLIDNLKWFLIWTLIYSFLLWILNVGINELSSNYNFLNNQIAYFILMGFGLSLLSRIVYCAIKKNTFHLSSDLIYWAIVFIVTLLIINFLIEFISSKLSWSFFNSNFAIIIITGALLSISIKFIKRANFGGSHFHFSNLPGWIWWIIILGLIIALIQLYVPYGNPKPLSDFNLECKNGNIIIKNDLFGLGKWSTDMEAGLACMDYKSSRCRYICYNEKPSCQCETALIHYLFTRKGEWIFGGWQ